MTKMNHQPLDQTPILEEQMAKDYTGVELKVGQQVAFILGGYREFVTGTVEKITAKKVLIKYGTRTTGETYRYFGAVIVVEDRP